MTIMTPIEGITAPPIPTAPREHDPLHPAIPCETFLPADETPLLSSRRADGWSAANQRLFLEAIAEGHGVEVATCRVGLSAASAYAFRRTAKGAAFALGWRAATLVARDCVADTLMVRALEGHVDTVTRADGTIVTRHRHDNRLAMALLARLDRQVEAAPDADVKAARLVAQEFDAFLDLVAKDGGAARAGLFLARAATGAAELDQSSSPGRPAGPQAPSDVTGLAPVTASGIATLLAPIYALAAADRLVRTGVATAGEVDVADLDLAARAGWTAEQWTRAEAAGLLVVACPAAPDPETALSSQHSQHSPTAAEIAAEQQRLRLAAEAKERAARIAEDEKPVWWDYDHDEWRTRFPPPADFCGDEEREFGHLEYSRALTEEEWEVAGPGPDWYDADECDAFAAEYRAWMDGGAAAPDAAPDAPEPPPPGTPAPSPALTAA